MLKKLIRWLFKSVVIGVVIYVLTGLVLALFMPATSRIDDCLDINNCEKVESYPFQEMSKPGDKKELLDIYVKNAMTWPLTIYDEVNKNYGKFL